MKLRIFTTFMAVVAVTACAAAADVFAGDRGRWLDIAQEATPRLLPTARAPRALVTAAHDTSVFQHWRYDSVGTPDTHLYGRSFKEIGSATIDFGTHLTGYFTLGTRILNRCQDAPVRLRLTFGELPAEMNTPLEPWRGTLSQAWMQQEVVTLHNVGESLTIPHRMACRYVRIELLGASSDFDFAIDSIGFRAVSSAGEYPPVPAHVADAGLAAVYNVSLRTLAECMQTVYEDGPKRDRRLWAGDFYLQALTNAYTFRNFDLTRRCLYLLAALSTPGGEIVSNVFEGPVPHPQHGNMCLNYSLLWNVTLLDYLKHTGDSITAADLFPVALAQIDAAMAYVGSDNLFTPGGGAGRWFFFDWNPALDTTTPMQGAIIHALNSTAELAGLLGHNDHARRLKAKARDMRRAARLHLYDRGRGTFGSGPEGQISVLSQAWMALAGVTDRNESRRALSTALADTDAVRPVTPYAMHYLVEAMIAAGMDAEARSTLDGCWGAMVRHGADTFWELYDPTDDFVSAYRFHPLNSACHAWSCTPAYFISRYPGIFR